MSKPIEPGCLALLIGARYERTRINVGKVVRVVSMAPFLPREWIIEGELFGGLGAQSDLPIVALEDHLLRIDGDEHVTTEEREDEEVSA